MEANTGHRVQSTRRWAAISLPENWPFLLTIYNNLFVNVWIYFNIQLLQNTGIRNKSLLQGHHLFHMETLLQWRHIGCDGVSSHQPHHCLLNCLFRRRSKKTSKLCVTVLCAGNSPETGEFPAQMASNAVKVSVWWRHHMVAKICSDELGLHWFKWWLVVCWASSNYLNLWTLQWRHNDHQGVSNHRCLECLLYSLLRRRSKKTSKLRVTGLCKGYPSVTCGFLLQRTGNAENVSIWWRHNGD